MCDELYVGPLDHARMWLTATGDHVLTGEPYAVAPDALVKLMETCCELGLQPRLSGRSPWSSDALLVWVERAPT